MARCAGAVLTVMIVLGLFATTPALSLAEQATSSPVATPVGGPVLNLNLGPGIIIKPLAVGTADQLPGTASLTLEQVKLGPGATSGFRELLAPELIVVQSGRLTVTDSLGISATLRPGQQELVGTNGSYEASNDTSSGATFLRLRLKDTQPYPEGQSASPGTPMAATPLMATPVAKASENVVFQGKNDRFRAPAA